MTYVSTYAIIKIVKGGGHKQVQKKIKNKSNKYLTNSTTDVIIKVQRENKKRRKKMNSILANDIINQLQAKRYRIKWKQFRSTNASVGEMTTVIIGNDVYAVVPIQSYTTVVAFANYTTKAYYEVGKYSRTTSKQVTQIYNTLFNHLDRMYFDKIYN